MAIAFGAATWPHQFVRIMLLEQLFRAIERLWCWREFSVPALAELIAYKAHHPDLALLAGLLMVCVLVLLLFTRPRTVLDAVRARKKANALAGS